MQFFFMSTLIFLFSIDEISHNRRLYRLQDTIINEFTQKMSVYVHLNSVCRYMDDQSVLSICECLHHVCTSPLTLIIMPSLLKMFREGYFTEELILKSSNVATFHIHSEFRVRTFCFLSLQFLIFPKERLRV